MKNSSNEKLANELKIITLPIEQGLVSLRGLSPNRLRFELEYALERGTTDNSFLFTDPKNPNQALEEAVLVHPPGATYAEGFINALEKAIPHNINSFKVVIGHINPNRVSLLKQLTKLYPQIQLISSNPGATLLKELWNKEKPSREFKKPEEAINTNLDLPEIKIIRQDQTLYINGIFNLRLIPTPSPRWPGGLIAFEENLGLLMSDKFFAAHLCTQSWAEINPTTTEEERRHFYDCLMAPMENQVSNIVDKFEELDIKCIAPCHGPAIDSSWRSLLNDYRKWGEEQHKAALQIILLFASAYGNTAAIADALANGIRRTGIRVESLNCEFTSTNELVNAIKKADAYLIGSPTLGGHAPTPIMTALGALLAEGDTEKLVGIFGSYGWSGEAIDLLEKKLKDGGFKFGFEPIKIKFSPNSLLVKTLEETGTLFGRDLIKSHQKTKRRISGGLISSKSNPAVLALGRVVGSLCILTTKKNQSDEIISGAMVASWVSQASFSPPGITIAIAKDRAIEAILNTNDFFILNILAANKNKEILKQFLQPFAPGANRLSGVTITDSPNNQPILPEALAWLEGCVKQRMECNDHWLIYAEINHGKVLNADEVTAVHHRKTGANY